ncbi:A1 family peptidase [Acetobacter persici]|uniref:pepsin-like aspartic protease n=1 Tax=Acetobacter persici TaxID=1076596 RepID=UPI0020CE6AE3|nr:pepsin-like aspartic protease [Acetobacter persici]MCP9319574.1 A1 family peptidase [Acetobacter persici]
MPKSDGITFELKSGPFQNNGASPWYTSLQLGTPTQELKINIDSGTNITWVTSTLCSPDSCIHFGESRFDWKTSSSFEFTDCLQRPFSFGPWGTMQVETGSDIITLPQSSTIRANMFFSADYNSDEFSQLDWDGGIGLPSSSAYVEGRSTFLYHELIKQELVDPTLPFVSFYTDQTTSAGTCQMGGYDETKIDGLGLFLPWYLYAEYSGVEYIWSSVMKSFKVGDIAIEPTLPITSEHPMMIALDTGASQFKGDDKLMSDTLAQIDALGNPDITMEFDNGTITIGPDIYNVLIEEGPDKGETLPQFKALSLNQLALVGSVLLDHCYAIYQYDIIECPHTTFSLSPKGVYLFNKPGGPKIISGNKPPPTATQPFKGRFKLGRSAECHLGEKQ